MCVSVLYNHLIHICGLKRSVYANAVENTQPEREERREERRDRREERRREERGERRRQISKEKGVVERTGRGFHPLHPVSPARPVGRHQPRMYKAHPPIRTLTFQGVCPVNSYTRFEKAQMRIRRRAHSTSLQKQMYQTYIHIYTPDKCWQSGPFDRSWGKAGD